MNAIHLLSSGALNPNSPPPVHLLSDPGLHHRPQVASYTLDASAKIYGYRVEALHGETLRMAGGLGRADGKPREDGDAPAGDDAAAQGAEKRRRKVRGEVLRYEREDFY